jgi:hypothetical protein
MSALILLVGVMDHPHQPLDMLLDCGTPLLVRLALANAVSTVYPIWSCSWIDSRSHVTMSSMASKAFLNEPPTSRYNQWGTQGGITL